MQKFAICVVAAVLLLPLMVGGCKRVPLMDCVCGTCDCVSCECTDQRVLDVVRQELAKVEASQALDAAEELRSAEQPVSPQPLQAKTSVTDGVVFSDDPLPPGAVITHINGVPVANRPLQSSVDVYAYPAADSGAQPLVVPRARRLFQSSSSGTCRIVNGVRVCN